MVLEWTLRSVGCTDGRGDIKWIYDLEKRYMKMGYVTGKTIKELRERRKLTQKELSEKIGVSDKTVSKWETGVSQS